MASRTISRIVRARGGVRQRRRIGHRQRVRQRVHARASVAGASASSSRSASSDARRRPPAGTAALLLASSSANRRDSRSGPASSTTPSASTTTSSQRCTEDSRCATMTPIRPSSSRSVARCTQRLGDRVHPGGGLVEDHHLRVADQDPGERHQLLLPGGQLVPALAELGVMPSGRPAAQPVRPSSSSAARPGGAAPGRTGRCSRPACRPGSRCAAARSR